MKLNGKITILINTTHTTIELIDNDASITFARIVLTPEQLSSALSRLAYTECDMEVFALDNVGKKMEHKKLEFKLPRLYMSSRDSDELANIAQNILDKDNEGWICSPYFASQDTFFYSEEGEPYARCIVRRWV